MVPQRRPAFLALSVLAVFALVVVSGAPRGMLRAVAISELDDRPAVSSVVTMSDPADDADVRLPSVRVSVAREDEEPSVDVQTGWTESAGLGRVEHAADLGAAITEEPAPFLGHVPARFWGDRAPPTQSI